MNPDDLVAIGEVVREVVREELVAAAEREKLPLERMAEGHADAAKARADAEARR